MPTQIGTPHREAATTLAESGRIVAAADYDGLGSSPGRHPWLDAATESAATSNLLRAVPTALEELGIAVPERVDLVGFSQGGHATMALARSLAAAPGPFEVQTIIGIAGPYALDEVDVPALVEGSSDPAVRSLALARLTYAARLRGAAVEDMYADGMRDQVHALFDGTHTDVAVATTLPGDPREMFTDQGWDALTDPASPFGRWLATTSDVCSGWAEGADVVLMHASGDTSALPRNTELCAARLTADGAVVEKIDLGDLEHIPSGRRGVALAAEHVSQRDR